MEHSHLQSSTAMGCTGLVWSMTAPSGTHRNTFFLTQINLANHIEAIIISNGVGNPKKQERYFLLRESSQITFAFFGIWPRTYPPSLHFLCKLSIFLTTYPPLNVFIICDGSLTNQSKLSNYRKTLFCLFPIISISQKIFSFFFLTLEKIGIDEKVICYHNISN